MPRLAAASLPVSVRLGGVHPLRFGTGRRWLLGVAANVAQRLGHRLSPDVQLFAGTWLTGFLAFSLFLA